MPKVSIIIPTYNYGDFICDAIDSVLSQTFQNHEIIVIDDGSTDNTVDILKKYEDNISYYYQNNKGPASARNLGIKNSKGDYICFLDADDVFLPDKLEIQLSLFENSSNKNLALLYSDFYVVNKNLNNILKYYRCKSFPNHAMALNYLFQDNYINTSTVMIPKDILLKVGLFNEEYKYLEDYDLWVKIGIDYDFLGINKPLVKTRSHYKNYSRSVPHPEKVNCINSIRKNTIWYKKKD